MVLALLVSVSCSWLDEGDGEIRLQFVPTQYSETKAVAEIPDTSDFILSVTKSSGEVVYSGAYGASPEAMLVNAGTYVIKVVSGEFSKPAFSAPQYGDEQCVVVKSGAKVNVKLICQQMNSGIRLKTSPDFLTAYPNGLLYLKSADGKLLYMYKETRIAYFKPGAVSLLLVNGLDEQTLMTKNLASQEIITLGVQVASTSQSSVDDGSKGGKITIAVDTTRTWLSETYTIGGSNGSSKSGYESAITISDAKNKVSEEDIWVCGFIVGGDLTSSATGISFEKPFTSETNIAIGPRSSTSSKSSCMSVQLPSGDIREALNLVDNPSNLGRKVYLKGDIVSSYYGIPGLKNISDFVLK